MTGARRDRRQERVARPSKRGMRTCVACRQAFEREILVRLVIDADGRVLVDYRGKAPGRGAHICFAADCITRLAKSKALGRAFGCQVQPFTAEDLTASILTGIESRIADFLGLGRRSRSVVSGMDSLERSRSRLLLLVVSMDASTATADRCRSWGRAVDCPVIEYGDREQLGRTQGVPERVALGVIDERVSEQLLREFGRRDRVLVAG